MRLIEALKPSLSRSGLGLRLSLTVGVECLSRISSAVPNRGEQCQTIQWQATQTALQNRKSVSETHQRTIGRSHIDAARPPLDCRLQAGIDFLGSIKGLLFRLQRLDQKLGSR